MKPEGTIDDEIIYILGLLLSPPEPKVPFTEFQLLLLLVLLLTKTYPLEVCVLSSLTILSGGCWMMVMVFSSPAEFWTRTVNVYSDTSGLFVEVAEEISDINLCSNLNLTRPSSSVVGLRVR